MQKPIIDFEALRIRQKTGKERRIEKEIQLNSIPEDIDELRAGYLLMRRLLNRARRIELEPTTRGKQHPVLISGWDTGSHGKPVEKYWFFEAAEIDEYDSFSTYESPEDAFEDDAFEDLEELELPAG